MTVEAYATYCLETVEQNREAFGLGEDLDDATAALLWGVVNLSVERRLTAESQEERDRWDEITRLLAQTLSTDPWGPSHPWKELPRFVKLVDRIRPIEED